MIKWRKILRFNYLGILFITWVILMSILVNRNYSDSKGPTKYISLKTGLIEIPEDIEWMNVLLNGKKIGYSYFGLKKLNSGLQLSQMINLNTVVAGMPTDVIMKSTVEVDSAFHLQTFNFDLQSGIYSTRADGNAKAGTLMVTLFQYPDIINLQIPIPPNIYPSIAIKPLLVKQGIKTGDRLLIPVFEPISRESMDIIVEHLGTEMVKIDSIEKELNKIKIEFNGLPTLLWMDDNGLTYREESLMGLVMEKTTPKDALVLSNNYSGFDLADFYAVPVIGTIQNPRKLTELIIEIQGLPDNLINSGPLSLMKIGDEKYHIRTSNRQPGILSFDPYLIHDTFIQSDHPQIRQTAIQLTHQYHDSRMKINKLVEFVYQHLKKVPVVNIASSVDILEKRQGDCSEHTVLFSALSRSIKIPTKIRVGIVYIKGKFLYHAWPSVYLNEIWVDVDPTFGQYVADATHIPILEGDFTQMTNLIPVLGKIKIKIINQQYEHE